MLSSILIGLLSLLAFFILSLLLVVGAKSILIFIKNTLFPKPITPTKRAKPVKPKTIRSISINPEEIDRIYVKKAS